MAENEILHPEWLIDDTAGLGDAQVFVAHCRKPFFVGELLPEDEAPIEGLTFSQLPGHQVLANIQFLNLEVQTDTKNVDAAAVAGSARRWYNAQLGGEEEAGKMAARLVEAIRHHAAVRGC